MTRKKIDRPVAARIVLRLKNPAAPLDGLELLSGTLLEAGLIRREPRTLRRSLEDPEALELACTFVDGQAARTWLRDPYVLRHRGQDLRRLLQGRPRTLRERDYWHELDIERVCACAARPWYMIQGPPWPRDEVYWCGECGLPVPNRQIGDVDAASWAASYRSVYSLWLDSGLYEAWAERQLSNVQSELNEEGRRLARRAQMRLGVPVFYELFIAEPGQHPECLNCGRSTRDIGWETWRACRACRLMFRHD